MGNVPIVPKAIELNPKNSSAYKNRGVAKKAKGDIDGAAKDSKKASELGAK